jgi:hypothetical protein
MTHLSAALAGVLLLAPGALAQQFQLTFDAAQSSGAVGADFSVFMPGTITGDFDAKANPGGTITIPGLFGGSGNQAIPFDVTLGVTTTLAGGPTGGFALALDPLGGTALVSDFTLDVTGGQGGSADLVLGLLFDSFHTEQPSSIFLGGIPLDLPLGAAPISGGELVQSGPALGAATKGGNGLYLIDVLVPAQVAFEVELGGATTPIGPLPIAVPLVGVLTITGKQASFTSMIDAALDEVIDEPLPGFELSDVPFDLPTILPPGSVAHILFSAGIESLGVQASLVLDLFAEGEGGCGFEGYCVGAPNSTGLAAELSALGLPALAADQLVLAVDNLPSQQFGFFLMGQGRDELPFFMGGQGTLCIELPFLCFRDHVQATGLGSTVEMQLDLGDLPGGTVFHAGESWNFQFWYRDFLAGPSHNLSNGVTVVWCP